MAPVPSALPAFADLLFQPKGASGGPGGVNAGNDLVRSPTAVLLAEAHARHEHYQQGFTPTRRYSDLLATVHKRLAEEWGVNASWDEALAYGQSIGAWPTRQ